MAPIFSCKLERFILTLTGKSTEFLERKILTFTERKRNEA